MKPEGRPDVDNGHGALQPSGCDQYVATVAEYEGAAPFAADPVADLVSNHGAEYAEDDGVAEVQAPPLDEDAGGDQDGLARQRYAHTLGHDTEEDYEVPIPGEEVKDAIYTICPSGPTRPSSRP